MCFRRLFDQTIFAQGILIKSRALVIDTSIAAILISGGKESRENQHH